MSFQRIKVLIVDDSAVARMALQAVLKDERTIEVIGVASDPLFALSKMEKQWPDVILLDVEMPRMDGITFLRKLMRERPTPVVICSTLTEKGAETTINALAAGAVSIITKPRIGLKDYLQDASEDLVNAINAAFRANVKRLRVAPQPVIIAKKLSADAVLPAVTTAMAKTTDSLVAIGTSTGGTQALEFLLQSLPAHSPGIVIVQHMPESFTAAFAARLNAISALEVREARTGDRVIAGRALIAPGGKHMVLRRSGAQYHVDIIEGPPVSRHCPSVDVLFRSVARAAGKNAVGIIMTGMGDDGAKGLKEMHDIGAHTIAQDEASCVVFGMPKEAIKLGAATKVLSLEELPRAILSIPDSHP